jgi:hypothetical protein
MLLIALTLKDGFWLPYDQVPEWYGVSSDSAEEGLKELRKIGLLDAESNWIKAPRSATDWTEQLLYTLQGPFSTAERQKAANFRRRTPAGEEVAPEQLAPGWKPTLVEFMTGKAPTPDELMSRKGSA